MENNICPSQLFESLYEDASTYLQENYLSMIQNTQWNPVYRILYRNYQKQIFMKYKIDYITVTFDSPFYISDMDLFIGISSNQICHFDILNSFGNKIEHITSIPNQLHLFQQPYFIKKMRNIYQQIHIIP